MVYGSASLPLTDDTSRQNFNGSNAPSSSWTHWIMAIPLLVQSWRLRLKISRAASVNTSPKDNFPWLHL